MRDAAADNVMAHAKLIGFVASHGLSEHFSLHLIHKHFDIPEGRIMVYEAIKGLARAEFVLCSPRKPDDCTHLRGLYSMDVFALTDKNLRQEVLTEFEMSELLSTVLAHDPTWLPQDLEPGQFTTTDWIATADYAAYAKGPSPAVPGIIDLKCLRTRVKRHYNVTCSRTKSGAHYQGRPVHNRELLLDGQPLLETCEAYRIFSHARKVVSASSSPLHSLEELPTFPN
ncbi:hypothetical protein MAC_08960 [Metarhizium acridum CQMa 102]|uniref:Uncharacterized protein n=1 Tax=Metarhizium acridum (strain CQMa 102) TaxID=655827 RepID=E9EGG2_METAQ|nr:uncharacterized protein MAC_08960 [Metarhizium acridum CQMa 102]EFY84976.1 hypothetical protein MAC_08960 [Metarhizium acridum CQMa 102]